MRLTAVGRGLASDEPLVAVARRGVLLPGYTALTIGAGMLALLSVTLLVPLSPDLAIPGVNPDVAGVGGLLLWIGYGLAGAARMVREPSGHGVLTFHLPFIVAAMAIGGPVAGGWVAMISSFDRRELEEVPWYGVLANHSALSIAAIAGGLVALAVEGLGVGAGLPHGLGLTLVAAIAGTLAFAIISTAIAAGVIVLRDGLSPRETLAVFDRSFRSTAVAETMLGWLLTVAYLAVGWWAPALCAAVVLALWRATVNADLIDRDELTGLLSRGAFAMRVAEAAERGRRGIEGAAYLFIDLDGFKAVNDGPHSHHIGDQVLAEVGQRLRRCIRVTDAAGRRSGDEFMVLFVGVRDEAIATHLAHRIHRAIVAPYRTDIGDVRVGASVGIALILPDEREFEPDVRQRADAAMYAAKETGGGIRLWQESTGA
jgi:diguanylate cyclase (GGDEF)-like protein